MSIQDFSGANRLSSGAILVSREPRTILLSPQICGEFHLPANGSATSLFEWTLSHPIKGFVQKSPTFTTIAELNDYVSSKTKFESGISAQIIIHRLALSKIDFEWQCWTKVHEEARIDYWKLDNRLMTILYRFILNRDAKCCVLCLSAGSVVVHHIEPKRRGAVAMSRYGKSVPTNLVTLCSECHKRVHDSSNFRQESSSFSLRHPFGESITNISVLS